MIIDARKNVVETMVEGARKITRPDFNFNGFTLENVLERTAKEAGFIYDILVEQGIKFEIVEKQGWGLVFKFNYKGKEIFTHTYKKKTNKLELYYWSEEYSCKRCGYKLSRVDRAEVNKFIENERIPKGALVGDDIVRDLADIFNCTLEAMYSIVSELGYRIDNKLLGGC